MNKIVAAVVGAALLTAGPVMAAPFHGGGSHQSAGSVGHASGGFRGAVGGYRGGYGGGYYGRHGYGGYPYFFGGLGFGFGLASAFYDPWYYDYAPYYGYYGYDVVSPAPVAAYNDPWAWDDGAEGGSPPPPANPAVAPQSTAQAGSAQVCGSWSWDASKGKYSWVPC